MLTRESFRTCGKMDCDIRVNDRFLEKLQNVEKMMRDIYKPDYEFKVTSGFRCGPCNRQTPGADPKSKHLTGEALDVYCPDAIERGHLIYCLYMNHIKSFTFDKQRRFIHISNGSQFWASSY